MPYRPHWWVEKFLRKKNWISDLKFFTFFMPKNDLFFDFWAGGPEKKIGISLNFLHRKKIGFGPPPFRWTCKFPHFWNVTLPLLRSLSSSVALTPPLTPRPYGHSLPTYSSPLLPHPLCSSPPEVLESGPSLVSAFPAETENRKNLTFWPFWAIWGHFEPFCGKMDILYYFFCRFWIEAQSPSKITLITHLKNVRWPLDDLQCGGVE